MPMAALDRSNSSRSNSASVLSIECLRGGSKADEWTGDMLQTGDIVEELRIGRGYATVRSPFKHGRTAVQKILHGSFKDKETSILVRVRRGSDTYAELQACIVPNESAGRKQYMLRAIDDPNYAVGFFDRTEAECIALQGTRKARLENALARAELQDGYVPFGWERKMQEMLMVPGSSCFLSMMFLPKAADKTASRYNDLEDTLARANAWLNASQATGVPLVFMNIQTESLLTKISGETASSTVTAGSLSDLSNLANASLYGFEDYHGVDIGVVRAVRLWYSPLGGEMSIEIKLKDGDTKLGFAISRTEEGFIYISSVIEGDEKAASVRSGLNHLYKEAMRANKRLVISRVCNQKVLPWLVSQTGAIRCFDTVSLSQKLSLHKHAKAPITLHVFLWDQSLASTTMVGPAPITLMPVETQTDQPIANNNQVTDGSESSDSENRIERDTAGEFSFRFRDFAVPNKWI
ncbi:uncharacterized protein LOC124921341 [Impatiens glandulifera]|uniref:uncharacterized protein LOC124921341 n=1 Tax=Impatiens glandulifera TaxID=253017 RepID=UPI001FB12954|nr:uncharacterized protein LOC124921341 [Impatiens glandulifera]